MRRVVVLGVLCGLLLAGCGDETEAPVWNHNPSDAARGPVTWGTLDESYEQCRTGTVQSPLDIARTAPAELPPLRFDYPESELVVENTGHVVEVSAESGDQVLRIGGDVYELVQFHLHAPSEHTRDGRAYAAEVHLVHESEEGEIAVVAVFVDTGGGEPSLVDTVLESAPEETGDEVELEGEWSLLPLLGVAGSTTATSADYDTYSGSLTTPGCTEGVHWIVAAGATAARPASIDRLHTLISGFPGYDGYLNNNRPTQPLSGRVVQRSRG